MDAQKKQEFVARMGRKRLSLARGGKVERKHMSVGGAATGGLSGAAAGAAIGSVVPGIGTAIGAIGGGLIGALGGSGLFSGQAQLPNIVDPVTGAQITNAQGQVVATQQQLDAFANTLNGVNGVQAQQSVMQQFQGVANGTGPNPALTTLAQQTGINVSQQASLMAGQRGAAQNVGLEARQNAQVGAQTQQTAIGQAATTQANQSLSALGQEATIAGEQVGETQAANTAAAANATNNQGQVLGAASSYNTAETSGQGSVNSTNASTQNTVIPLAAGAISGAGAAAVNGAAPNTGQITASPVGANANGTVNPNLPTAGLYAKGGKVLEGPHKSHVANFLAMAKGGKVPAMVSPGEIYLSPDKVQQVIREGANPIKIGEKIPGKAKVRGDSRKNDTVARNLDEGGVVIPRHILTGKMSPEKAELFVHRAMARKAARQ